MAWIMFEGKDWEKEGDCIINLSQIISINAKSYESKYEGTQGQWKVVIDIITVSETFRFQKYAKSQNHAKIIILSLYDEIGFKYV